MTAPRDSSRTLVLHSLSYTYRYIALHVIRDSASFASGRPTAKSQLYDSVDVLQQLLNNYKDIIPIPLMLPDGSSSSILPSAAQAPLTSPPPRKTLIDLSVNDASRHTFSRQIQPTIDVSLHSHLTSRV